MKAGDSASLTSLTNECRWRWDGPFKLTCFSKEMGTVPSSYAVHSRAGFPSTGSTPRQELYDLQNMPTQCNSPSYPPHTHEYAHIHSDFSSTTTIAHTRAHTHTHTHTHVRPNSTNPNIQINSVFNSIEMPCLN